MTVVGEFLALAVAVSRKHQLPYVIEIALREPNRRYLRIAIPDTAECLYIGLVGTSQATHYLYASQYSERRITWAEATDLILQHTNTLRRMLS